MNNEELLSEAKRILHLAVNYDNNSNIPQAIDHYIQGVEMLNSYLSKFLPFPIVFHI